MLEIGSHLIDRNSPLISIIWHKECDISQKVKLLRLWVSSYSPRAALCRPWTWWTSLNPKLVMMNGRILISKREFKAQFRSLCWKTLQISASKENIRSAFTAASQPWTATPFRGKIFATAGIEYTTMSTGPFIAPQMDWGIQTCTGLKSASFVQGSTVNLFQCWDVTHRETALLHH